MRGLAAGTLRFFGMVPMVLRFATREKLFLLLNPETRRLSIHKNHGFV
jgi:hypothetical protein